VSDPTDKKRVVAYVVLGVNITNNMRKGLINEWHALNVYKRVVGKGGSASKMRTYIRLLSA
jgi:hypothetical protein